MDGKNLILQLSFLLWTSDAEMSLPSAVIGQIYVLTTQSTLGYPWCKLSTMTFRIVSRISPQHSILTNLTLDVISLFCAFI